MGMKLVAFLGLLLLFSYFLSFFFTNAEDPYVFYEWEVTYGTRSPLGVRRQVILINGQFPGPAIEAVTNYNIVVNVFNKLDEPFLITWHGIKQRRVSWQDGVLGTNCPIPPKTNWTYKFQLKDQIGSFHYYPSTALHKAAGGFGALNINQRSVITKPYKEPHGDYTFLIADWYNKDHKALRQILDNGKDLPPPDGLLINGVAKDFVVTGEQGKTYKFRVTNAGTSMSFNFRIQDHTMILIEVEGAHTLQEKYDKLDVHPGQTVVVLVTLNGPVKDYFIVASTRLVTKPVYTTTAVLRYSGSSTPASLPLPPEPEGKDHWSMKQARTIRLNLTSNAARPNPQGSFHYGQIKVVRTLVLANSKALVNGKLRYGVNGISYVDPKTPLKLADHFNIPGVFDLNTIKDTPTGKPLTTGVSVVGTTLHDFIEIVFQNDENTSQSWHIDGTSFYVVGYGGNPWTPDFRKQYNLADGISRHTVQVFKRSWTAILVSLDNKGMWNCRAQHWSRRYLGQELYIRVWEKEFSPFTEADIPKNALLCGKALKS